MVDEVPPSSDRRRAMRRVACFPGYVEHGEAEKETAMIADLAETGARLLLRHPELKVGDDIRLELHVALDKAEAKMATGRVVRVEPLPDARASLWTHEVGVDFHETITLTTGEIESLEKRQAPFGKR